MTAVPLVDWSLLGRVVVASVLGGVGLVIAFSIGLAALSFARDVTRSRFIRRASVAVALAMTGVLAWALWWGFELITHKA